MTLPTRPSDGDHETAGDEAAREEERRRLQRERLRDEVRRLEQAEQFTAALRAIRESGLTSRDPEGLRPDIARLKQAARLQASYGRACAAQKAGDGEAAALLSAVVAVDPRYRDAAKRLYEAVSGVSVGGLEAEVGAAREAASRVEAQRDRLARGRGRLMWVAGAEGIVLCSLLGWMAWHRPPLPSPAVNARSLAAQGVEARNARPPRAGSPEVLSTVAFQSTAHAEPAPGAVEKPSASIAPASLASPAPGASLEGPPPPELEGPCRRIGASCSSTLDCCWGSMCYGNVCQDSRRTIVFGQYRP